MSEYLLKTMFVAWHSSLTALAWQWLPHRLELLQWCPIGTCQWKKLVAPEVSQSKDDTVVDQFILAISSSFTRDGIKYVKRESFRYRK